MTSQQDTTRRLRIDAIDVARGVALVAMAVYHFCWDLEFFGYLAQGTAATGPLKWFARSIASSFLFLVGVSLVLAHAGGPQGAAFIRRFAKIAAAAAVITVATYWFTPGAFVFFGILHHIALASVLGLAFLRLSPVVVLVCAAVVLSLPLFFRAEAFGHPVLLWTGLAPTLPRSNDYVPLFPWFAMVLVGIAATGFAQRAGFLTRMSETSAGSTPPVRVLRFLGHHSLATYLLHQPVLIAGIYLFSLVSPAERSLVDDNLAACQRSCTEQGDSSFCTNYCGCAISKLDLEGLLEPLSRGEITPESEPRIITITQDCAFEAENAND
ncbi:heparan-alpha-glucosaminide N-acetyltransferase [Oricola sp.]|uniref:heparan-alpha-glucosaminide N-acetyltransferase n=1 Tax=Oricola sp. TaxID=1979950 RepID=UPI003BAA264F